MDAYLAEFRINGVKNIDKMISLHFYNATLPKKFSSNNSNIKAIYGENGVGKSAIIHAMDIYKNLITQDNYLNDSYTCNYLDEIINKKVMEFSIGSTILIYDDESDNRICYSFSHDIRVKNMGGKYQILSETICEHKNNNKAKDKLLYESERGEIKFIDINNDMIQQVIYETKNLLGKNSICTLCFSQVKLLNLLKNKSNNLQVSVFMCYLLLSNTRVILSQADEHINYISRKHAIELPVVEDLENLIGNQHIKLSINYINVDEDEQRIKKKDINIYRNKIAGLTKFIRIFKKDLKDIEIKVKELGDEFLCTKYFIYDDYCIHSEFESTGIKKLMKLYNALGEVNQGGIVFIDELDASLHDVYLCSLLAYLKNYGKGQLCFTTHNLGPMDVLKNSKHSIDFLIHNSTIVSWKKSGHYSVKNLYKDGMIKNSPFNVHPLDFLGVFYEGDD